MASIDPEDLARAERVLELVRDKWLRRPGVAAVDVRPDDTSAVAELARWMLGPSYMKGSISRFLQQLRLYRRGK